MKLLKLISLLALLALPLQAAQQHTIGGDPVINAINGVYTGIKGALATGTGTNLTVDFTVPTTVWTPGAATAIRFTLSNKPTATTNGGNCQLQIIAAAGTQLTNVVDNISWRGAWGTLTSSGTNYVDIWWDGVTLNGQLTPSHGVITPAQITASQNDYSPTDLAIADEMRISSDAARTITGLAGRPGGQFLLMENIGSFSITLSEQNASSTATNRFRNGADVVIGSHQTALLIYSVESTRWKASGNWSSGTTSTYPLWATSLQLSNSAAETVVFTNTIPANTLGTNKAVTLHLSGLYHNESGGTRTVRIKFKLGSTTLWDQLSAAISSQTVDRALSIDFQLMNKTAATQGCYGQFIVSVTGGATTGYGGASITANNYGGGTSSIDTTADVPISVTMTLSSADSGGTPSYYTQDGGFLRQ